MNDKKSKWTSLGFEAECYPPNNSERRYTLKLYPKDKALTKKEILVIMLNPSTADENKPDTTCRSLIKLCNFNDYNSITICNIFSLRTPNVMVLNKAIKINTANDDLSDEKLKECIKEFNEVLCAWGKADKIKDRKIREILDTRIKKIEEMLKGKKLYKFGDTSFNGKSYPLHPYFYNTMNTEKKSKIRFTSYNSEQI